MAFGKRVCNPRRMDGGGGVQRDLAVGASAHRSYFQALCGPGPDRPALRVPVGRASVSVPDCVAGLASSVGAAIQQPTAAVPIWFAALLAVDCQAHADGKDRTVLWNCVADRALYTNYGADLETIEPLGVQLQCGDTVAVSWLPGDSTYRIEIFRKFEYVA
jgi:hypothetical protein